MKPKKAARIALDVYDKDLDKFRAHGYTEVYEIEIDNCYCVIAKDDHEILMAFRGSDDLEDWLRNLSFKSTKDHFFGKVHSGFLKNYKQMEWSVIDQFMKLLDPEGIGVQIIGHSAGGSLAEMFALRLSTLGHYVHLHTFGSPRVGKGEYKRKFQDSKLIKYDRYVNGKDPVPRLPRSYMGYKHVVPELHSYDGWFTWLWFGDFDDHDMKSYLSNIQ